MVCLYFLSSQMFPRDKGESLDKVFRIKEAKHATCNYAKIQNED